MIRKANKLTNVDCDHPNYTEYTFRAYAKQYGIPIKALLNAQEAINIIDQYNSQYWVSGIHYILDNEQKMHDDLVAKAAFYAEEKVEDVNLIFEGNGDLNARYAYPEIEKSRIDITAKKIADAIKKGSCVITVDIADILREQTSLFLKLEAMGYQITPVK